MDNEKNKNQGQSQQGGQEMILDLYNLLLRSLPKERAHDFRFKSWAKRLTSVNRKLTNGFAFEGEFVGQGTVVAKPGFYLVCTVNGSRANQRAHYSVVELDSSGQVRVLDIYTNGNTPGWALRIRDKIAALLENHQGCETAGEAANPLAEFTNEQLLAELRRRGVIS